MQDIRADSAGLGEMWLWVPPDRKLSDEEHELKYVDVPFYPVVEPSLRMNLPTELAYLKYF